MGEDRTAKSRREIAGLLCAVLALGAAGPWTARTLWDGVVAFDPGIEGALGGTSLPAGAPARTGARPDAESAARSGTRVTLILVDGLRLDASREMKFLNELT